MSPPADIRLVVFDWAGTTVDHGSLAPLAPFVGAFAQAGVTVSAAEARGPMGMHKREHIQAMLRIPEVAARWQQVKGKAATETDIDALYQAFIPLQLGVVESHCQLVPGLKACVAELRRRGIKIGATTGYFREAAEKVYASARVQGYVPDHAVCAGDVAQGRPAPWMVFRCMEALGIYPSSTVVKVGDTVPDIEEGRNAGCWSLGVLRSSSEIGLDEAAFEALPAAEQRQRMDVAAKKFLDAGAHATLDSMEQLPGLLDQLTERLRRGERP